MSLARPFIRRPVASCLLAIGVVLVGLLAWRMLPVAPLPQVDFPTIQIYANLPGASPESMAATVATPLERALGSIPGVTAINSNSNQGSTQVWLEFDLDRDLDSAARDVQAAINTAIGQLPAGMPRPPSYRKISPSQAPIMALAFSSPNLSPSALYDAASTVLAQKLAQITGVGQVGIDGASLPAVRIQLNPGSLAHYGIALDEVRNAISSTHMGAVKNNVPANGEDGVHYYGGLLMGSSVLHNQRHIQTGHTISAYERSLFGWVALDTLAGTRTGVTLGDLYTYGEAAVLPIGHGDTERALFLSNHQRLSYFDSLKVGVGVRGDRYEREGLWLTGLLAHFRGRRDAKDCTAGTRPCVDILPADNVLDKDFVGDTYGPGSKTQLTPWTRPSINGCSGEQDDYCDDLDLTWAAIDAVRYLGDADSTIVFDFYEDFRAAPAVAIRADSWMGRRTHGAVFENEVRVTEGAALTVEAGTSLTFGGGVVVEEGARLTVEEGAVLRLGADRRADVYGTLDARSAVFAGVSGERWDGLYFHPGARGTLTDLRLEDAETGGAPVVRDGAQVEVR